MKCKFPYSNGLQNPEYFRISLSQCSRRSRRIVTCQESPKYGRRIQVTVGKLSCSVAVGEPGARESEGIKGFTWRLSTIRDNKLADVVEFIDRNVNGAIWKVGKSRKGWISVPDDKCMERDLLILLDMFKSIFNCPIHRITLDFGNDNFDPLLIETDALHRAENITIMSTALSHQEADFLFDNLITDKLVFHGYAGKKYVYQKPLNFSKILISCAGWINFEKLMQMANTCKSIDLQTATQISDNDLNQFIKIWIDSDNKTLETVTIVREPYFSIRSLHRRDPVEQFQRPAIMSGINARQGCKKRPDAAE